MRRRIVGRDRKGIVLPMVATLLVVLLGMLALTFDLGRVAVFRAELQNAADSSAMAGASALGTDNLIRPLANANQTTDIASARTLAQKFAQANLLDLNGGNAAHPINLVMDKSNDVDAGLLTTPSVLSQIFLTSGTLPLNSVRTRTYADSTHGGVIRFAFAPVLGQMTTTMQATATATIEIHAVGSMKAIVGATSPLLPITMSYSDWQLMLNNKTGQDAFTVDPVTGLVSAGSDGLQEQQLYPGSNGSSSNNGLLQFGTGSHSNSVLKSEIESGPTSDQMITQWSPNGVPPAFPIPIGADPGWRASDFDSLSIVVAAGLPRLIPINDGSPPGNGANGSYNIVAFAPVRVVSSNKGGKGSGSAMVQSALITDPTLIPSSTIIYQSGSGQGGIPVVRLTR